MNNFIKEIFTLDLKTDSYWDEFNPHEGVLRINIKRKYDLPDTIKTILLDSLGKQTNLREFSKYKNIKITFEIS